MLGVFRHLGVARRGRRRLEQQRVEHGARREGNVAGVARELAHLGAPQLHRDARAVRRHERMSCPLRRAKS